MLLAASGEPDAGHEPGKDYTKGTLREKSLLRKADKTTILLSGTNKLFFEKNAEACSISATDGWVEVEGEAFARHEPPNLTMDHPCGPGPQNVLGTPVRRETVRRGPASTSDGRRDPTRVRRAPGSG